MKNNATGLAVWEKQILEMQQCKSALEILSKHGPPSHKEKQGELEI
jgi:hypothetical protein